MKLEVDRNGRIELTEVYEPIILITADNEHLSICMRDSGFEIYYAGDTFNCKRGIVE